MTSHLTSHNFQILKIEIFSKQHPSGTRALSRVFTRARVKIFQGASEKSRATV